MESAHSVPFHVASYLHPSPTFWAYFEKLNPDMALGHLKKCQFSQLLASELQGYVIVEWALMVGGIFVDFSLCGDIFPANALSAFKPNTSMFFRELSSKSFIALLTLLLITLFTALRLNGFF